MNWQEYYRSRTISADEAAAMVKAGMRVDFPLAAGTVMQRALAARGRQIVGVVDVRMSAPLIDAGWLGGEAAQFFNVEFELFIGNIGRAAHDRHTAAYLPNLFSTGFKPHDERPAEDKPIDFAFVNVTTPNAKGFVSFGPHQWNKRAYARRARHAIAEVDASMTRTYGDVYMHVSEFDYFVEATPPPPNLAVIEQALATMDAEKREGIRAIVATVGVERIWPIVQYLHRTPLHDLRVLLGMETPPAEFKAVAGYFERTRRRRRDDSNRGRRSQFADAAARRVRSQARPGAAYRDGRAGNRAAG